MTKLIVVFFINFANAPKSNRYVYLPDKCILLVVDKHLVFRQFTCTRLTVNRVYKDFKKVGL